MISFGKNKIWKTCNLYYEEEIARVRYNTTCYCYSILVNFFKWQIPIKKSLLLSLVMQNMDPDIAQK